MTVLGESLSAGVLDGELGGSIAAPHYSDAARCSKAESRPTAQPAPRQRGASIVFMSRFDREKGVHELLQAFAALEKRLSDIDLVMAGEGDEADA